MSKNLINKYVWLVETIYQAGYISKSNLNNKWKETDWGAGEDIPERTFYKWKNAVEELFGIIIDCERKGGYHYYIANADELQSGGVRTWLLNTLSVSNLLIGHQKLHNRILTEKIPSGQEHLSEILNAMSNDQVISITYQSYWRKTSSTFEVEPYCIKIFKQRWYLLAHSTADDRMRIYALDRIIDIDITERTFQMPDNFDAESYFCHYYGVIVNTGIPVEDIQLKVSADQANYLRSVPLHHTQKEERADGYSIFTLRLCPEHDFLMEVLSMGQNAEIIAPKWLRETMREEAKGMWGMYKK